MADTRFIDPSGFREAGSYRLMPFRFGRFSNDRVLLTSQSGEFAVLPQKTFEEFVHGRLSPTSTEYLNLKSQHFLSHGLSNTTLRSAASQWRTKKAFLEGGPKLHIFVPTLRCNQSCGYCQVSRQSADAVGFDMTEEIASAAIDIMLSAPAPTVTMEFQGGEPLNAFELVCWMVETTTERAKKAGKKVCFVICTNLTLLTDQHIAFFERHNVAISTSLDGPAEIHNRNRPLSGSAAHHIVVRNIRRCKEALGEGSVSALMTTTVHSLGRGREIVDEYLACGLDSIFLRDLNPYGYAAKSAAALGYDVSEFAAFYADVLGYILALNLRGTRFSEGYATILLRKILTPFGVGFVDLQSPTGQGFGVLLYNYDGSVYASDEGRMLAEMGDPAFRLGSVHDGYMGLLLGETMTAIAAASVAETLPGCSDCVYVPYCGADPIRHYRTQCDLIGHRPTSSFCRKQRALFSVLFGLLADATPDVQEIFLGWLTPARSSLPRPQWL